MDAPSLQLLREGDVYTVQLEITLVTYMDDGRVQKSSPMVKTVRMTPQQRDEAVREGIGGEATVTVGPGVERVRVIVVDRGTNQIGSVSIPTG